MSDTVSHLEQRVAMLERMVADLTRRLGKPFALARSTLEADDTGPVQTAQMRLDALSVRNAIPVLYGYGMTANPPVNTNFHVTFIDGDRSKAVAVASGHQPSRLRKLGVGDSALYDVRGAYAWLTKDGPKIDGAGKPTLVVGDLHVTGEVIRGFGTGDQVTLGAHRHGTGNAAAGTTTPTPGT